MHFFKYPEMKYVVQHYHKDAEHASMSFIHAIKVHAHWLKKC